LNTWLEDAQDHQFRVIGVFGMAKEEGRIPNSFTNTKHNKEELRL
jgi:hypothetical protein